MRYFQYSVFVICFIILCLGISATGMCADVENVYSVVHVEGNVRLQGNILKLKDEIKGSHLKDVVFEKCGDYVELISSQKGMCVLCKEPPKDLKENEIVLFIKNCLIPSRKHFGGRYPFINETQMKDETEFLISKLRDSQKKQDEIEEAVLDFLSRVYFGKSEANMIKAKKWLCGNFQFYCKP